MSTQLDLYPAIKRAFIVVAHDCGCINREETEESVVKSADKYLEHTFNAEQMQKVDSYLKALDEQAFVQACIGEQNPDKQMSEIEKLTSDVLDKAIFGVLE